MANKSITLSSGFQRLMNTLTLPLPASVQFRKEQTERPIRQAANSEPAYPIWPDVTTRTKDPHERMRADAARLRQATLITRIQ